MLLSELDVYVRRKLDGSSRLQTWHQRLQTCYIRGLYIACLDERSEPKYHCSMCHLQEILVILKNVVFYGFLTSTQVHLNFRVTLASRPSGSYVEVIRIARKLRRTYTFSEDGIRQGSASGV